MNPSILTEDRADKALARYEYERPLCDISETGEHYQVALQMPGVSKGDVSVQLKEGHLMITGYTKPVLSGEMIRSEIGNKAFRRVFSLGKLIDRESIDARWQNGLLILTIAKKEEAKPREIKISYNQ